MIFGLSRFHKTEPITNMWYVSGRYVCQRKFIMRTGSHDLESEKFSCESWPRKFNSINQMYIEMLRRNS